ncbi:LIM domain only protein 3-like isoform X2 [Vespula pensylvanica]|uniref:LIM domain only protein 3-like isoform X2 n=2 Tax=Vespinae TaxID=7439 RepID=UPI001CBA2D40|nr:LIM domain only protein 3-like isoform X2 [Vespula pensylvanica]
MPVKLVKSRLDLRRRIGDKKMMMDVSKNEPSSKNGATQQECAGCGKTITERYLLKALDLYWHEDCLKCGCCDCRLGEVGSTLYTKANLILCKRDYLRLFGNTGYCAACNKVIPAFEMVMRARTNVYHLECFSCQECDHKFCVGDQFYLYENKILCEYHYKERVYFANMPHPPPNDTLAHIKRQVTHLQPQTVPAGGPPRQANGETAHNHNGYPAPATSSAHNVLNPMNNLNGINAQAPYDAK